MRNASSWWSEMHHLPEKQVYDFDKRAVAEVSVEISHRDLSLVDGLFLSIILNSFPHFTSAARFSSK